MPIEFVCECGKRFRARDGSSGRSLRCPACGLDIEVPPADALAIEIDTSPRDPVRLRPRRRPSARGEGMGEALPRLIRSVAVAMLLCLALVVAWGLFLAPRRGEDIAAGVAPVAGPAPDAVDVAERERMLAQAEADREEAEAEAKEARLREATRAVLAMPRVPAGVGAKVIRSEELSGNRWAFLLRQDTYPGRDEDGDATTFGGHLEAYLVEGGAAIEVSEDRLAWETESAEDLAGTWADRSRGDGPYRVKSASRTEFPATLRAEVVNRQTGRRYRLLAENVTTASSAEIKMIPLDR